MAAIIQLDRNQYDRLRALAQQEGAKDLTLLSEKAAVIVGDANWQIMQEAKAQKRYVIVTVARLPDETGRLIG